MGERHARLDQRHALGQINGFEVRCDGRIAFGIDSRQQEVADK